MSQYQLLLKSLNTFANVSDGSAVGIATGYGLDDPGVGVEFPGGSRMFNSAHRPERHCGPPGLLSSNYRRLFPLDRAAEA
jgi:hypothetical protein